MPFDKKVTDRFSLRIAPTEIDKYHTGFGAPHLPVSVHEYKNPGEDDTEIILQFGDHHAFGDYLISEQGKDVSVITGLIQLSGSLAGTSQEFIYDQTVSLAPSYNLHNRNSCLVDTYLNTESDYGLDKSIADIIKFIRQNPNKEYIFPISSPGHESLGVVGIDKKGGLYCRHIDNGALQGYKDSITHQKVALALTKILRDGSVQQALEEGAGRLTGRKVRVTNEEDLYDSINPTQSNYYNYNMLRVDNNLSEYYKKIDCVPTMTLVILAALAGQQSMGSLAEEFEQDPKKVISTKEIIEAIKKYGLPGKTPEGLQTFSLGKIIVTIVPRQVARELYNKEIKRTTHSIRPPKPAEVYESIKRFDAALERNLNQGSLPTFTHTYRKIEGRAPIADGLGSAIPGSRLPRKTAEEPANFGSSKAKSWPKTSLQLQPYDRRNIYADQFNLVKQLNQAYLDDQRTAPGRDSFSKEAPAIMDYHITREKQRAASRLKSGKKRKVIGRKGKGSFGLA